MTYTEPESTPEDLQPTVPDPEVDTQEHYENEPPDPEATEEAEVDQSKTETQIDKELADSVPASDPPSGWAGPPT